MSESEEADPNEAALEVIGASKRYGDRQALDGVSVRVRAGEVHGLLGPNGAGKTTLLRALLGLVALDGGRVRLLGRRAGAASSSASGFVDAPRFYPYLAGRRNLELLARLDDPADASQSRVARVLGEVGLREAAGAKVSAYSAGMRQRLGLAAALLRAPRLLLLDEPTTSLDPAGARDVRALVRRLADAGTAVLLSSHDMGEVESLCEAVTIVDRGRVLFSGSIEELREQTPARVHALSTSDDARAAALAEAHDGVEVEVATEGRGLDVRADEAALDRYVIALGQAGIAVRALESRASSLEALFLGLTEGATTREAEPRARDETRDEASDEPRHEPAPTTARGALAVASVEIAKLAAQAKVWAALGASVVAPVVFVVVLKLETTLPEDTLFGRFVTESGFAVPLCVLGFAASWALPALTSLVAGDVFAAEDRHGTWPTLLTRSRSHGEIFLGKTLAALAYAFTVVSLLAIASLAAGVLFVGAQPLVSLSGTLLSPGRALGLDLCAWASALPPTFAFAGVSVLASVATRSSVAGVGLPVVLGLGMELFALVNVPDGVRGAMLNAPFGAWHGLAADPPFQGPLAEGAAVSAAYFVASLVIAWAVFRRRDVGS